jgi:iron complex outermembrane receptor protein
MKNLWMATLGFAVATVMIAPLRAQQNQPASRNATGTSAAMGTFWGRVTDAETKQPLAGVTFYFADLRRGAVTNAMGEFRFTNLPRGSYTAEVSLLGYTSIALQAVVDSNTQRDIALSSSVVEQGNVIVTGVSKATAIKETPTPVTIVSKTFLNRSAGTNLIDAFSKAPGVSQLTTGPAISKPFIRGLGYNRLITINDGVRQEGQQWGDEHGIEIDEYSAQKVEVLRGPASLMYGSDALAGVINILSNVPVAEGVVKANLSGSLNANNSQLGGYANVTGNVKGLNWNLYQSLKKAGDYQNAYDGKVLNSRFKEANFGGYVGINKSWGYSHLLFSNFNQKVGLVEGERDNNGRFVLYGGTPLEYTPGNDVLDSKSMLVPYQHVRHTKLALDNSFNLGNGRLSAVVAFQQSQRQEFGNAEAPDEAELWFDLKTINYNIAYHAKERNHWKTSFGLSGMQQSNRNKGDEVLIPEYDLFDIGAFVFTQKKIGSKLNLSGGLRIDNRNLNSKAFTQGADQKFEAFKKTFTNVSGSAGLSYALSKFVTLKANAARGFRAPSIPELAANGQHEGTNRYEVGEQDLKSETSLQFDGGAEIATSHFSLGVTAFYNGINNFIFYGKLQTAGGQDSLIDNTTAFKFNQQDARLSGLELTFDLHPHPLDWLHFENTLSMVRGRFANAVDGSRNLPLIARARLLSELRAEFAKQVKAFENLYVKAEMDLVANQNNAFTGFDTETDTKGYTLFNIGFGTDVVLKERKLCQVIVSLNNIVDVSYQNHLSRLKYTAENVVTGRVGVFNMGRNFVARLIVPLEWKAKSKN